jgi:hypothetical protein
MQLLLTKQGRSTVLLFAYFLHQAITLIFGSEYSIKKKSQYLMRLNTLYIQ